MVLALAGLKLDGFEVILTAGCQCDRGRLLFALLCPLAGVSSRPIRAGNPEFIPRLIVTAQEESRTTIARYPEGVIASGRRVEVTPDSLAKIVPRLPSGLEERHVFHTVWM